jgi:hypothetical protein
MCVSDVSQDGFRPNLISISKLFVLTMEVSICPVISDCIFVSKALYTKPLMSILRSRMVLLNRKIDTFSGNSFLNV